jgi:hypothetical protein
MGSRLNKSFCFLLLLVVSRGSLAQSPDSTFRRQHSLNRPDSVLVKDTLLFPTDTVFSRARYTSTAKTLLWADSGSITYTAHRYPDSAVGGWLRIRLFVSTGLTSYRWRWQSDQKLTTGTIQSLTRYLSICQRELITGGLFVAGGNLYPINVGLALNMALI